MVKGTYKKLFILFIVVITPVLSLTFSNTYARWYTYDYYGSISEAYYRGHGDAFDGMYYLRINGILISGFSYQKVDNGRGVVYKATRNIGGVNLKIERYWYFPPGTENWARGIVYIENPSNSPVTLTVEIYGNLGSDGATKVWGTDDGDTVPENNDRWIGTDDWNNGGDPSLGHWMGYNRIYTRRSGDNLYFRWSVQVPAKGHISIIFFSILGLNQAEVKSSLNELTSAVENSNVQIKYFEDLINDEWKSKYIENVINLPEAFFVLAPKLTVLKDVNETEVYTYQPVTILLNITQKLPKDLEGNYTFERISVEDYFPSSFNYYGVVEEGISKIAVEIIKKDSAGNEIQNTTVYVPISLEGDNYRFTLDPTGDLSNVLRMDLNQSLEIYYVIIPRVAGEYTLPSAVVSYYLQGG